MKKKYRDIVVDDVQYGWTVYSGGKEQDVQVWKDKKELFSTRFRVTSITPKDITDAIKEYNKNIKQIELNETLDKKWSAFLNTIPWRGYGSTIAESNRIFSALRKKWMQKMVKMYGADMTMLIKKYIHD